MCEPAKSNPIGDVVAGVGAAVDTVIRTTGRVFCRRFTTGRLAAGRRRILWLIVLFAAETAVVMYSHVAAMLANAGLTVAFSIVWYAVSSELVRRGRGEEPEVDENEVEFEFGPDGRPRLEAVS